MGIKGHQKQASAFSIADAIEECVVSRGNFYLGLWAGRQFGLCHTALHDYARSVVEADYEEPGHEDVLRKLARDFAVSDCTMPREEIERQLCRTQAIAARQFSTSD
jgi:hypothetical protein